MKKIILAILLVYSSGMIAFSQTNATNFTANDCNSNSHTLFTELDNGNIVVLAWIMPCLSCTGPVKTAYNIAKSYNSKPAYAGRVKFYLIDDFGDQNCTYLSNWATNNNIGPDILSVFDNAPGGNIIKEDDYGGTGMPHICIVGGTDHKIFFNKFNSDADDPGGIEYAIFSALTPTSVDDDLMKNPVVELYPNPSSNVINLDYTMNIPNIVTLEIHDVVGKKVFTETKVAHSGKNSREINIDNLLNGTYFIVLKSNDFTKTLRFNITK